MGGYWGLFLFATTLLAPGWYLGDRMLLRPALRNRATPLLPAAIVVWRCIGLASIIFLTVAFMRGDPAAIVATITAAIFVYTLIAATIWLIAPRLGQGVPDIPEAETYDRACKLVAAIREAAQHAPLSAGQKSSITEQAIAVPRNIAENLRQLERMRRIERLMRGGGKTGSACDRPKELLELRALETRLTSTIESSLHVLMGISVPLMKVGMARDDYVVARILTDLTETNKRLTDLAESWEEVNQHSPIIKSATTNHHS